MSEAGGSLSEALRREIKVGYEVVFHLRGGASIAGRLDEIGHEHVTVAGSERRTTLRFSSIEWWETSIIPSPPADDVIPPAAEVKSDPAPPAAVPPWEGPAVSSEARIRAEIEIDTRFSHGIAKARLNLENPGFFLDLSDFPAEGKDRFRVGWEKVQQKYKHAERIGEIHVKFGRIQSIVGDLRSLDATFPGSLPVRRHLAYCQLLVELNSAATSETDSKALPLFSSIASSSDEPRDWLSLAAGAEALGRRDLMAPALVSFFKHAFPAAEPDKWFALVGALQATASLSSLEPWLDARFVQQADQRLLVESAIYLLRHFKAAESAERLLNDLLAARELDVLCKESVQALLRLPAKQNHSLLATVPAPAKPSLPEKPKPLQAMPVSFAKFAKPFRPGGSANYSKNNPAVGASLFRRAQEAVQRGDLKTAEALYRQEIDGRGAKYQSALKDLAWLIMPRVGQVDEAIQLLQDHRAEFTDKQPVDQLLAQLHLRVKRYAEAAAIFHRLRGSALPPKRPLLKRQEAYCLFAGGDFAGALKLLEELRRESPFDLTTLNLIEQVKHAEEAGFRSGTHAEESFTLDLASFTSGLSPFAEFILAGCNLQEVGDEAKARGFFIEKDFSRIEDRYDRLRGRVPQAKAQLLLTLAVLCRQSPEAAGERDMHDFLRRALAFMGEAAINDKLHRDTARCYLTESLHIDQHPHRSPSDLALTYLLATYLNTIPGPGTLLDKQGNPSLEVVLRKFLADQVAWQTFEHDFSYYATMAPAVVMRLQRELPRIKGLRDFLPGLAQLEQSRREENDRFQNEIASLAPFARQPCTASNLNVTALALRRLAGETRFTFDQQRMERLANFVEHAAAYWLEQDYVARENKFRLVESNLASFRSDISGSPTKLAVEALRPIADRILTEITRDWEEYSSAAKPIIELSNVLVDDYYISKEQVIAVALEVASKRGGAPVESLRLLVTEENGLQLLESDQLPAMVRGGDRSNLQIKLKLGPGQVADQAFTLRARLRYRTSRGDEEESPEYTLPIRLGRSFERIVPNPYERYAGGKEIDNPEMFFGRKELLQRIIDQVTKGPIGQCFVLYGQKRSGKTSVLRQVERNLAPPILWAEITLGTLDTRDPEYSFNQECIDKLYDRLLDLGLQVADWPTQSEVHARPLDGLRRALRKTEEAIASLPLGGTPRVVLLIDEFTYIYDYIREGIVSSQFMRQWKALLQMGAFSAVVVGQDSMKQFKEEYANEFGSTKDERLTYLSEPEAINLATEPILLNEQSRYRGKALDRLLETTAGNPFYMQIVCSALVDHLNDAQAPFVTEADLNIVTRKLVDKEPLSIDKFDPLIAVSGGDHAAARDAVLYLLTAIAHSSNRIQTSQLPSIPGRESLLHDMIDRQVLRVDAAGLISIRVGLFAEWLRANRTIHS